MYRYRTSCMFLVVIIFFGCSWHVVNRNEILSLNRNGLIDPKPFYRISTFRKHSDLERNVFEHVAKNNSNLKRNPSEYVTANHVGNCPHRIPDHANDVQPVLLSDEQLTSRNFEETTSANFTSVEILNYKPFFNLCDLLIVRIVSRDWQGNPKSYGGDFFRLKIYSENPYSAANADRLIDFNNGTYIAYFTLRWSGQVQLQIKLINPVELLPQMQLTLQGKIGLNITFAGEFISNNISEEVICRYVELPQPHCNLSNPRTHGPWYCQQPKDPRLSCKDWTFHKMYKGTFLKLQDNLTPLSKLLILRSHMVDIKNNCTAYVTNQTTPSIIFADSVRPFCSMDDPMPTTITAAGHFFNGTWYQNNCKVHKFSPTETMSCVKNRMIIIIGDSTIRQIYYFFKSWKLKTFFRLLPDPEGVTVGQGPHTLQSDKYNTSIYYHFHGLPMSGSSLVLRTKFIQFTVDKLDSIESGSEVVVILSLWAHFITTGKEFYVERLKAIKSGIQRFLDRCPNSKVIIKGANTKSHPSVWIAIVSSESNIMQHELALRALFQDEKRVGFIDAFDITRAQPYKDYLHPDVKIVEELANKILTYLCKN